MSTHTFLILAGPLCDKLSFTAPRNCNKKTPPTQRDPRIVDRPEEFLPQRWLPDAVQARSGTPAEILDNKILASIFGFGPRMCLGARLAKNELYSLVSRIIQDWEISVVRPHERKEMKLLLQPVPSPSISVRRRERN